MHDLMPIAPRHLGHESTSLCRQLRATRLGGEPEESMHIVRRQTIPLAPRVSRGTIKIARIFECEGGVGGGLEVQWGVGITRVLDIVLGC